MLTIPGAIFFITLAFVRMRTAQDELNVIALLLAIQAGLAAFWLIFRKSAVHEAPWHVQAIAWLSALLPLAVRVEPQATWWLDLAPAPGLVLNLWALVALGGSFSVAPADRGLAFSGPYRHLRHPMYAGELASLFPAMLATFSVRNLFVFGLFAISLLWRIRYEERVLSGYYLYAQFVRWKLLPGVW